MIKVYSKQLNSDILVNTDAISHVLPSLDNGSIIHLKNSTVISTSIPFLQLEQLLIKKLETPKEIPITNSETTNSSDKIYPDEFPDDFPRYRNGKINHTSKKYMEFMQEKQNA